MELNSIDALICIEHASAGMFYEANAVGKCTMSNWQVVSRPLQNPAIYWRIRVNCYSKVWVGSVLYFLKNLHVMA